uniref:Uncharacterized protein n=1 Tax=Romanomermis culicivorax TaxID=13658 RepID=A0A915KFE4_ROMCU
MSQKDEEIRWLNVKIDNMADLVIGVQGLLERFILDQKEKDVQRIRDEEVESRDEKVVPGQTEELMDIQELTVGKENVVPTTKDTLQIRKEMQKLMLATKNLSVQPKFSTKLHIAAIPVRGLTSCGGPPAEETLTIKPLRRLTIILAAKAEQT